MKRVIGIVVSLCILVTAAGCGGSVVPPVSPTTAEKPTETQPVVTAPTPTQPTPTQPLVVSPTSGLPMFEDLLSLGEYMNAQVNAEILEFSFEYTGSEPIDADMLRGMLEIADLSYTNRDNTYAVTVWEYPGEQIVEAWRAGDTSSLSADEQQALTVALDMVEKAKTEATDTYNLELRLHDMLIDHITYYTEDEVYDHEDPIRYMTVIGALLDGQANCQGYTDAFYTLATIAGFQVGRMVVDNGEHITNTICLDGNWYVVDVTHDDADSDGVYQYYLFNATKDVILGYSWEDYMESRPIVWASDEYFYYNRFDRVYEDVDVMAQSIVQEWAQSGTTTFQAMLRFENDEDLLKEAFSSALQAAGKAASYTYWSVPNERDIYYTIRFD